LGYTPPSPETGIHPEVEKVIQDILKVCHENDKKCAIFCTNGEQGAQRAKQGFDMVSIGFTCESGIVRMFPSPVRADSPDIQINVSTDTVAMVEGIARDLQAATAGLS
jgi:hypothetical protein